MISKHALMIIIFYSPLLASSMTTSGISCESYEMVKYRLTFIGDWSEEKFPKQYPQFRPHAQWSKLIGRTHSKEYNLWSLGTVASNAFKKFVQDASTDDLDKREAQGFNGVFDTFIGPAINAGVGESSVDIFVSYTHNMVSAAVKLIPSPDWFVGLDGIRLCPNGTWINDAVIPLDPVDAGTDRGYTFTSPKWASRPRQPMSQITSQFPNHRASSFYYPELDQLPHIAYAKFELLTSHKLHKIHRRVSHRKEIEDDADDVDPEKKREELEEQQILHGEPLLPRNDEGSSRSLIPPSAKKLANVSPILDDKASELSDGDKIQNTIDDGDDNDDDKNEDLTTQLPKIKSKGQRSIISNRLVADQSRVIKKPVPAQEKQKAMEKNSQQHRRVHHRRHNVQEKQDCVVGDWESWSACSKTCGIGAQKRQRPVIQPPKNGRPCPPLEQEKWCGSMRACRDEQKLFSWLQDANESGKARKRAKL